MCTEVRRAEWAKTEKILIRIEPQADATVEEPDANRQRPGRRSASSRPAGRAGYRFPVRCHPVGRLAYRSRGLARPAWLAPNSERLADRRAGASPRTAPGQSCP